MAKTQASLPTNEDRGSKLLALYWTQIALAVVIIILRFYSRMRIQGLGPDDWIMLFTVVSYLLSHLVPKTQTPINSGRFCQLSLPC